MNLSKKLTYMVMILLLGVFFYLGYGYVIVWKNWNQFVVEKASQEEDFMADRTLKDFEYVVKHPSGFEIYKTNAPEYEKRKKVYFFLVGNGDPKVKSQAMARWASDYLAKPDHYLHYFQKDDLLDEVIVYLLDKQGDEPTDAVSWYHYTSKHTLCGFSYQKTIGIAHDYAPACPTLK
jgi:hypothetical protein